MSRHQNQISIRSYTVKRPGFQPQRLTRYKDKTVFPSGFAANAYSARHESPLLKPSTVRMVVSGGLEALYQPSHLTNRCNHSDG